MHEALTSIPCRREIIRAHKESGGRVAAVLPIHYPRALFRAFQILPVELWGPPEIDPQYSKAHLQPYVCPLVHNALSYITGPESEVFDLVAVPHTCDSLQGLCSILTDLILPRQPVFPIYLPRGRRESDAQFLANEFHALYRKLEALTSLSPSEDEVMACILREEDADEVLAELNRKRKFLPLCQRDFYHLLRSREYLPAERFCELAKSFLAKAENESRDKGLPIILSGIVPEPMSLFEFIERAGGVVVADDLACCGRRLYGPGEDNDVFRRMAKSILSAPPDSTRGSSIQERADHMVRMVKMSGAKAVLFYCMKFCEPELFGHPPLRDELNKINIPTLVIESELSEASLNPSVGSLELFLETILCG